MSHVPVLLEETIELLRIKEGDVVVDATVGSGGHFKRILEKIGKKGRAIGLDMDSNAIENLKKDEVIKQAISDGRAILVQRNFSELEAVLEELGVKKANGIMADLGWRTEQIEDKRYGLSFMFEGPLDMRLGGEKSGQTLTAEEIVNRWGERELADIFGKYGEERYSRLVAKAIVSRRKKETIVTTTQLAELLHETLRAKYKREKINPATRVFQALRIVVNEEMENLERFLPQALGKLEAGGRLGVIAFHSLEDKVVKRFLKVNAGGCVCPKEFPICVCGKSPLLKIITKKPAVATAEEVMQNPRSRSAKFRVAEKI